MMSKLKHTTLAINESRAWRAPFSESDIQIDVTCDAWPEVGDRARLLLAKQAMQAVIADIDLHLMLKITESALPMLL